VTDDVPHSRRRAWIGWTIAGVVVLLLFCVAWVAIRGIGATAALSSAVRTTKEVRDIVGAGSSDGLTAATKRIAADTSNARVLTADPIWRGMEILPWLGANLAALREVSEAADSIARDAVPPLRDVAMTTNLATIGITGARIDIGPLAAAAPDLEKAAAVLTRAERSIEDIDAHALAPPFGGAMAAMAEQIQTISHATGQLAGAARIMPLLLPDGAPRNVLVIVQNNAELRSSGGTPLTYALLRVQGGRVDLAKLAGYGSFGQFPSPVAEPSPATAALFGGAPAVRMPDALSAPSFPEAALLASRMWAAAKGDRVDAVVAIDAVALAMLLDATGPQTVGGVEVTGDDAAAFLLGGSADHTTPASAATATTLVAQTFTALVGDTTEPRRALAALAAAGEDNRVRTWIADPAAQDLVARTTLAGTMPADGEDAAHVGVLINDATGARLDVYARAAVSARLGACGPDGRTVLRLTVDWTNALTEDAAAALPASATGASDPVGTMRTRVAVMGPEGWNMTAADASGEATDERDADADGRAIRQYMLHTRPSDAQRVTVEFTAPDARRPRIHVLGTPMMDATPIEAGELACG
jgi:hypothetical protein